MNNKIITGVAVLALLLGTVNFFSPNSVTETVRERIVGAQPGPEYGSRQFFNAGFQSGGTAYATTTTAATYTLTSTELGRDITHIEWNAGVNTTLTTMATTSNGFGFMNIPKTGDKRTYDVYNASTTAAATITWAAGTGVDLQEDEGETVIQNGLEFARLTFIRKANTDVALEVEVFQVGD